MIPAWVADGRVSDEVDGDQMLARGIHPLALIKGRVAALHPRELVRLDTSFRPQPLIDLMQQAGASVYSAEFTAGRHSTYFGWLES